MENEQYKIQGKVHYIGHLILIKVMINSEIIVQSMNFNGPENIALKYIEHKLLEV